MGGGRPGRAEEGEGASANNSTEWTALSFHTVTAWKGNVLQALLLMSDEPDEQTTTANNTLMEKMLELKSNKLI